MRIKPIKEFRRMLTPPPDKSITIRALIMGAMASGVTVIENPLFCGDTVSAMDAVAALGAEVSFDKGAIMVKGGLGSGNVNAGNSATTLRLLVGAVAGLKLSVTFTGDESLSRRSNKALIEAISNMGAEIDSKNGLLPLTVRGGNLHGIDFVPSSPSAQVKSAVLLAGLNSDGETRVTEPIRTRTHTEDMLKIFGADISTIDNTVTVRRSTLKGTKINVPGDISSAAYPIVLALKKGFCYLRNVGTSRRELIDFLLSIGADIEEESLGDRANLSVKKSELRPFKIDGALSTALIDELPLLAVLACFIDGESIIKDAVALRNKECDRIKHTVANLYNMGAQIKERSDGFIIKGSGNLHGGNAKAMGDHRMAMSMAVANALSESGGTIDDEKCVDISYPGFWELFL